MHESNKTIRWGVLGAGRIARKFASDLKLVEGAELVAIGSQSVERAAAFANEFPVKYTYGSYEALAENPEIDVIYIATPHNQHCENTILCLAYNKAALCEKPFAMNHRQASEMVSFAKKKNLFLMEALWTKFLPHYQTVMKMIRAGELGTIKSVLANFGFRPWPPIPPRLFDPALGGGTIMDIGIYNIFMALSFLGRPDAVEASMTPGISGVDMQCATLFKYDNGAMAQLFCTFLSDLATETDICGDKGRIKLTSRYYEPTTAIEFYSGRAETKQIIPCHKEPGFGYQFEIRHVCDCLRMGLTESNVHTHRDSLLLMETIDRVRKAAGIFYAEDKQDQFPGS